MRYLGATALGGALVLLAACGGDPRPVFSPTPSVSSSPSASPAAGPPTMPSTAKQHTKAGAVAFVKYYWAVANYAQRTLDVAPLRELADSFCGGCEGGVRWLSHVRANGGSIRGGATIVVGAQAQELNSADQKPWMNVRLSLSAGPQIVNYPGSRKDEHSRAARTTALMTLRPIKSGWLVNLLDIKQ